MSSDRRSDPLPPLLGGILIGGKSRRMASAKALLEWDGETFVERIARTLSAAVSELFLFGSGIERPVALARVAVVPDQRQASGPLAGLLAAFETRPEAGWLMLSCDQPLLSVAALSWLIAERRGDRTAVLPRLRPERIEPFPGIYEPGCRPLLTRLADGSAGDRGRRAGSLQPLGGLAGVHIATVPSALAADFLGANTPQELAALRSRVAAARAERDRDGR